MTAFVGGARIDLARLVAIATEIFGAPPSRASLSGPDAWISLPIDAPAETIDELATRVGGYGLAVFECGERSTTYVAPGRDDELDVTETANELRRPGGLNDADVAWCLATERWEIGLARYLITSGMIELAVWRFPFARIASVLTQHGVPSSDREWEQLGERLREQLSCEPDIEVPEPIDHGFFANAAKVTRPAR